MHFFLKYTCKSRFSLYICLIQQSKSNTMNAKIKITRQILPQHSQTTTLLYGTKAGEPDYKEDILFEGRGYTNLDELERAGIAYAEKNNIDRLRIAVLDMRVAPDFSKAVNL